MDDVDAVQATIARNMLHSGDWVTARLDGIAYLEKAPLVYWTMATSYRVFGVHDWAARLPLGLMVVLLCWTTFAFARWAFNEETALYSGLALSTCVGLFLFTRILIPDAMLTLTITGAMWAWLRLLDPQEEHRLRWSLIMGACLGAGLLLKGLIALVFPLLTGLVYMTLSGKLLSWSSWRRVRPHLVVLIALAIALPWYVLATVRNPPYFVFSMHSGPGEYRGFFWFYFFNEHILRFLNLRYPRDYNTVPRLWFWLLNLVWLFPWSVFLVAARKDNHEKESRWSHARLLALCWVGVVMVFFTFSTTQEYYSMPIYPAMALLIGSTISARSDALKWPIRAIGLIFSLMFIAVVFILFLVRNVPAVGDISQALQQHPELYTLSMGHIGDLTINSFAYLKLPLGLAAIAFGGTAIGVFLVRGNVRRTAIILALGMVVFFQAARVALIRFDPYLGSYSLSEKLLESPPGELIVANTYYAFSSAFFYTGRRALLWNGRLNNLEYGSNAPGAPNVFIDDDQLTSLWNKDSRYYLLTYSTEIPKLDKLVGKARLFLVKATADNYLYTNHALP